MNLPEFRRYMEEQGGHAVLTPDELRYVDVGQDYCRMAGVDRGVLIGHTVPEMFPPDEHGGYEALLASFARVRETGQADKLGIIRYDVRGHERWWRVDNVPIFDDGAVKFIVHRIEDVTLQIQNARAIKSQRLQNRILYGALVVIMVLLAFAFTQALHANRTLAHQNRALIRGLGEQRKLTAGAVCHTTNELVHSLRVLIVSGAKGSFVFEKLFRQYGAPPYKARVALAAKQAKSLAPLDCPAVIGKVK